MSVFNMLYSHLRYTTSAVSLFLPKAQFQLVTPNVCVASFGPKTDLGAIQNIITFQIQLVEQRLKICFLLSSINT